MSYLTQIVLKTGTTNPGTVLLNAEPAYDSSNNVLYIGEGVGNPAVPFYSGITFEYIDGSLATKAPTGDYVKSASTGIGLYWVNGQLDVSIADAIGATTAYVDGSLATRDISINDLYLFTNDLSTSIFAYANDISTSAFARISNAESSINVLDIYTYDLSTRVDLKYNTPTTTDTILGLSPAVDIAAANTFIGQAVAVDNVDGGSNTGVGSDALPDLKHGSYNIGIGVGAGSSLADGSNNIYIGANTTATDQAEYEVVIGTSSTPGHGSNSITLGGAENASTYLTGALYLNDVLFTPNIETYTFVSAATLVPVPTGTTRVLGIKNITAADISVYCPVEYSIDDKSEFTLLPYNTIDLYDYDASHWYVI